MEVNMEEIMRKILMKDFLGFPRNHPRMMDSGGIFIKILHKEDSFHKSQWEIHQAMVMAITHLSGITSQWEEKRLLIS